MKILIINAYDISGGAARATFRLHEALIQNGIDTQMLVADKKSDIDSVITQYHSKLDRLLRKFCIFLDQLSVKKYKQMKNSQWGSFSPASIKNGKLIKMINSINPDIVHLCWICAGMIAIEDLAKINAPIVWRLPDMWAFTGGCHYVAETNNVICDKYTVKCQKCEILGSNKIKDLSFKVLKRKKKTFAKIDKMTIIGVSRWLTDCAKKSAVFSDKKVVCLPNPINTNVFKPANKLQSRLLWNLPRDKKLILFGAVSATSTLYKGYDLLIEALNKISFENVEFVVFGSSEPKKQPKLPYKIRYLGHLNDDVSLVSLYSACDVMVVPSKREAFGQTASESLACGTPVVAFEVGGLPDIIDHKINGYLAQPFDTLDLAQGIDWVLNNENYDELSKSAREKVVREFDYSVVAKKYINLYEEVLRNY